MGVRDRNFWSALNQKRKVSAHLFWDFDYCGVATFFFFYYPRKEKRKTKIYNSRIEIPQILLLNVQIQFGRISLQGFGPKYNLYKKRKYKTLVLYTIYQNKIKHQFYKPKILMFRD